MLINEQLKNAILQEYIVFQKSENFKTKEELEGYIQYFKEKFGDKGLKMEGKELLYKIHGPYREDEEQSLVYWLENKDDDEFPNYFGGCRVGNSGHYQVYFSPPDNCWKNKDFKKITESKAIKLAERNRDVLLEASKKCGEIIRDLDIKNYREFDNFMQKTFPELYRKQWVHKYLFLMNSEVLSPIHSKKYLLHMLLRLGIIPDNPKGYYELDYYFIKLAQELNIPIIHLTHILFRLYGKTYRYWKIDIKQLKQIIGNVKDDKYLDYIKDNKVFCFGYGELGDLEQYYFEGKMTPFKEKLIEKLKNLKLEIDINLIAQNFGNFYLKCGKKGWNDILVFIKDNNIILIGQLENSDFTYEQDQPFPYQRKVKWFQIENIYISKIPKAKYCFSLIKIQSYPKLISKIEKIIRRKTEEEVSYEFPKELNLISNALKRKKQVILYGPPGTGKTYWAQKAANVLAAINNFKKNFDQLSNEQKKDLSKYVVKCCFHPSYGYEDFIIGYQPKLEDSKLVFKLENGIFKELCEKASKDPNKNYYLIIDEINRGDIPRIFGELMMIIEKDKRGEKIKIPYSDKLFQIPPNIYIIGTMNTADRSIALLDTALRRRFAFIEFMPNYNLLNSTIETEGLKISLKKFLISINQKIRTDLGKDGRNLQIGHAYFLKKEEIPIHNIDSFSIILRQDIIPLLEEYCYGDYEMLANILGKKIVNVKEELINEELFQIEHGDQLLNTLVEKYPQIVEELKDDMEEDDEENE
ncbi:MAG: McrB family protein [Candidatus Helarchaeota archaeon]